MVNGVSGYGNNFYGFYRAAAGVAVNHGNDVENMIKFVNGQPITQSADPTIMESAIDTLPFLGIFGGFQGLSILKNNGLKGYAAKRLKVLKRQGLAKGWNWSEMVKNINKTVPYTTRSQALQAGKETVLKEYGNIFKKSVAVSAERGFIGRILDKIPGYTKLRSTGIGQAMGKSNAGWMAVLEGGMELATNVVPTFQTLGAGAGFTQLGKSAVKVAAGAAGWLAGDAIGKGIGAAIGTAICPGIGTAIGTFVGGFLGGIIGSAVTGKVAKTITGKSELEKANDKQIAQVSQQVEADSQSKAALAKQTLQQAEEILAQDPQNKEALAAKAAAENVLAQESTQQQAAAQAPQMQQMQPMTQMPMMPSFQGIMPGVPVVPGFNGFGYDMNVYNQAMSTANMINTTYNQTTNPFMTAQNQYTNPYMTLNQNQLQQVK